MEQQGNQDFLSLALTATRRVVSAVIGRMLADLRGYAWLFGATVVGHLLTPSVAILFAIRTKEDMEPEGWGWWILDWFWATVSNWFFWLFDIPVMLIWCAIVTFPSISILARSRIAAWVTCGLALGIYNGLAFSPYYRGQLFWAWLTGTDPWHNTNPRNFYIIVGWFLLPMALTAMIGLVVWLFSFVNRSPAQRAK